MNQLPKLTKAANCAGWLSAHGQSVELDTAWRKLLSEVGITPSVGSVGDSYDNALAETVIGLFKTELIRQQGPWRNVDDVEFATLRWVDWFNNKRLLEPIGDIPPVEKESEYYQQLEESAMAA